MRTSATGSKPGLKRRRGNDQGFTLIELMIVVVLIGLMSAVVMLVMPDPRGRLIDEAERFAARAHAARDMAIVESRPMALRVTAAGYGFDMRRAGRWQPIEDKPFRAEVWSEGTTAIVGQRGLDRVSFDSTGLASQSMTVTLVRSGETMNVYIGVDGRIVIGA